MDLSTYCPTKNWKKRVWWWGAGLAALCLILRGEHWLALPVWAVAFIIIDERIKEGYFFDPRDVKKPFTHENLAVVASVILAIVAYLKRRRGAHEKQNNR